MNIKQSMLAILTIIGGTVMVNGALNHEDGLTIAGAIASCTGIVTIQLELLKNRIETSTAAIVAACASDHFKKMINKIGKKFEEDEKNED